MYGSSRELPPAKASAVKDQTPKRTDFENAQCYDGFLLHGENPICRRVKRKQSGLRIARK